MLFDAVEACRATGCGIGLGGLINELLVALQPFIVALLKPCARGFVVALLQILIGLDGLVVDDALAFDSRVDKHRGAVTAGGFEGWGLRLCAVTVLGADGQQNLRGLVLVGA